MDYFLQSFNIYYTGWDFLLAPFLIIGISIWSKAYAERKMINEPVYKYFRLGLMAKIGGGVLFCALYTSVLHGGDTTAYFWSAKTMVHLFFNDLNTFFDLLFKGPALEAVSRLTRESGYMSFTTDPQSFMVVRLITPFTIIGLKSYILTTIWADFFLFHAIWQWFKIIAQRYPSMQKQLSYIFLFIPSVLFWSGGILKDLFTYSFLFWFISSFYKVFIQREGRLFLNIVLMVTGAYFILAIKPYIFFTSLIFMLLWVTFNSISKIKSFFVKILAFPVIIGFVLGAGMLIVQFSLSRAGKFYTSLDTAIERAWIIQDDLTRDYYGKNSFDIGYFEPTLPGILSKAPIAIASGAFRPFLWEAGNVLMIFSGLENLVFMVLFSWLVFKLKIIGFFRYMKDDSFLLATFIFIVIFSFVVGLTTANFGALVRYRIPMLPFMLFWIIGTLHLHKENKSSKLED